MSIRSFALKTVGFLWFGVAPIIAFGQQFQQPTVVPTGSWPAGIVTADVNGDGKADLIYTDYGATPTSSITHILLGNGDGTFTVGQTIATAGASIAVADFNKDGHVDLEWVWGVAGLGKVYQALGNGDGTFAPAQELGTFAIVGTNAPQFGYVMGAQLHDTGYLDLLVEDVANPSLLTLTSDNSGTLVRLIGTKLQDGTGPMFTADLNGDGHTDLVIQTTSGAAVDVFLGSVDGILGSPTRYTGSGVVSSMLLHDVDGDGHLDLVVESAGGRIDVFHGNPDGSFAAASEGGTGGADATTGAGGHLVAVTDVGSRHNLYTTTPAGMSVLLGQSNLSFSLQGIYNAGPGRTSFAVADFNGDGIPDIAVDSPEGVAILFGNADGSLQTSRSFAAGKPALSGALGAFSGSGNLDAVVSVAATQAQLLQGNGDGTFVTLPAPTTTQMGSAGLVGVVAAGDFNGDGKLDLVMTQSGLPEPTAGSGVSVQYGSGDGTFGAVVPVSPTAGTLYGTSVTADFNGDGIADVADLDLAGNHVLLGQSDGGFVENDYAASEIANPQGPNLVAAGDLNGDGRADLVSQNGAAWTVYLNSGKGSFTQAGSLPGAPQLTGVFPASVTIADLDGDGNGDVIVAYDNTTADHAHPLATASNSIYVWYGKGDGTFESPVVLAPSRNFYELAVVDVDGDGLPDLVMSDGYLVSVQKNLGGRSFGAETHFLAGMGINSVSTGDVNKDGFTDLVVSNGGSVLASAVINHGTLATNSDVNTGGITVLLNRLTVKAVSGKLTAAPSATLYGETFTITAAVTPPPGGPAVTGTVSFAADGAALGTATVSGGVATITGPGTMPVGKHMLTAQYSGNSDYEAVSLDATHAVTGIATTVLLTISTPATIYYGQVVDGLAQVSSSDGSSVTGTITFYDGTTNICVTSVAQGASCPSTTGSGFAVGTHTLTAVYSGDTTHEGSTSNAVTVVVLQDTTTTSLGSSANPAASGQSVVFAATVQGAHSVPAGVVTFMDGSTVLGTGTLSSTGVATFSTASLAVGSHSVTASYVGNLSDGASVSTVLTEVVNSTGGTTAQSGFTLTVTGSGTVGVGQMANLVVAVNPVGGYGQAVQLSCGDLPSESACTFETETIPAAGGRTTLQLSTIAPHDCGSTTPYFTASSMPFAGPMVAGLVMLFIPWKRRRGLKGLLLALVAIGGLAALSGCGGACTDLGTEPGSYTIKVIGTSTGPAPSVVTAKVVLNVTLVEEPSSGK